MKPPTRFEWHLHSFYSSNAYLWLLASGVVYFGLEARFFHDRVFAFFALFGFVVMLLTLVMRSRMTYDEHDASFTVKTDVGTTRRLVLDLMRSMEPDQEPEIDECDSISIDLWRKGAVLGAHLVVRVLAASQGSEVRASSRYHVPQIAKYDVNSKALLELQKGLTDLDAKATAT